MGKKTSKLALFFAGNRLSLALSLLLLTGCAELYPRYAYTERPYDPYAQADFDQLLTFGANMANIPASSRAEVCHTLLKRQNKSPGAGVQLHLMVGRLLSDDCGDIPKILDEVGAIPAANLYDERLLKLVAINTEALKRMNNLSKKVVSLGRRQKKVQSLLESKDTKGSKKNEARLLREKLEAIRSMEKHLDESGDTN
ncbi:MAG: hypothetical protein ACU88J_10350 [Gammaproteobacteria bacterium]